jgi:quercetin dioxygenase-like cupin family protein
MNSRVIGLLSLFWVLALCPTTWLAAKAHPTSVSGQDVPPEFSAEGARQVLDNERVVVWTATDMKGRPSTVHTHERDRVSVDLGDASVRITTAEGVSESVSLTTGQVLFEGKDTTHRVEIVSDNPRQVILIDLKEVVVPPSENLTGFANAYPRADAVKLLENDRVVVWEYTWTTGVPSPTHFHDKDAVIVFMGEGELRATTPDGTVRGGSRSFGDVVFSPRNVTHVEELIAGSAKSIVIELK